jgi:two-component system NarL family response regulator
MSNDTPVPNRCLKVLVVEDAPIMQKVLGEHLGAIPALELVGVVETVADSIAAFQRLHPDVVILDLALRQGSGLDVLPEIRRRAPACRVLIFTSHDTASFRSRCAAAGADAFFSKIWQFPRLIELLHFLAGGDRPDPAGPTGDFPARLGGLRP